ncbi:MAG TPA: hypothetical protein VHG53_01535 [Candidatus Limnocylindria bacterium]|nr:hypothetical protein [Candidatus Limnocylindria bacterium]
MSPQAPRRQTGSWILVPLGTLVRVIVGVAAALLVLGLIATGTLARVASGTVVADRAMVVAEQAAAERDLERGYERATDQVRKARALKLAIPAQQVDAIANKALADLFTLRHSALVSMGQLVGAPADAAEAYAKSTEQALDQKGGQQQPSAAPVLLAPRLYAIVSRFNDLATQIAERATTELTQSPTPTPTPTVRPTPTPIPTR